MKRKRELVDQSDDDQADFTVMAATKSTTPPIAKKKDKKWKLLWINVVIFSTLLIPLLAISHLDPSPFMEGMEKIIGEKCWSKYWKPKNLTQLENILSISP